MMKLLRLTIHFVLILCGAAGVARADQGAPSVDFMREIRPILSQKCFTCHGPDEGTREAGLRLDEQVEALAEADSGQRAIVPGAPNESELYRRVTSEDEYERMPPGDNAHALTADQIDTLRRWIEQGAVYEEHWAFQPPQVAAVPQVDDHSWAINPIDRFVSAELQRQGITPSPEADRPTLIRRLSLDLLGLPPTPEQVRQFVEDEHPLAYQRLVERLLSSPRFGERWGKHWLDLARYADSNGYLGDSLRPYAYLYRDWVLDAINRDMPFDQFTIEQLAGDLLPGATLEQQIATGFHRNAMKNTEAGADREEDRVNRMVNYVSTTGTVFLGLTVGCAECHTHKFDPISHEEFFQLYAFFNNTDERDVPAASEEEVARYEQALKRWEDRLARRRTAVEEAFAASAEGDPSSDIAASASSTSTASASASEGRPAGSEVQGEPAADLTDMLVILEKDEKRRSGAEKKSLAAFLDALSDQRRDLLGAYEKHVASKPSPPSTKAATLVERPESQRRVTRIHLRGSFRDPGPEVQPGTLRVLHPLQSRGEQPDRLDLARWLVDPANPLMHRTTVNHLWRHLFGRGLVNTPDNLGTTGEPPSHRELLDWLALELVNNGWSRKAVIRQIVLSATYRQASHVRPELVQRDPYNILLARQSRFRLEAEVVRDLALSVSDLLHRPVGGPSIRPPLDSRVTAYSRNKDWPVSPGADQYRRGLYILFRRNTPYTMLVAFDAPDTSVSCTQRERSNSPLQSLTLLNDPVFVQCAQRLSRRGDLTAADPRQWIRNCFELCLSRAPSDAELDRLVSLYDQQLALVAESSDEELTALLGELDEGADLREQAARLAVARTLINVNEFITRE